ncbi:lysylphosphatidylglycerol synthase transmembrane domain-containing protein [Histidinibacterium lentulum]|uniref:UPF0104 family protein n=1 Tax=Histidinibacterium lentulum TaxID=2480588 RepID=A0A3N2QV08_9RHOB|nr:lysylphosphatidylglycerol synthase transmembrane domain-containing protein [Histidinibacterium lentulum]ROT98979.1 UPF0104 family protein [Histidinibacterium lentulum]
MNTSSPLLAAPAPPPVPSRRRWRDALLIGGLAALVLAGLAGLAAATGWEEVMHQLRDLGPMQIGALLALSLVNYLGRGLRWHLFARRLGLTTGLRQNLRHFLGGFAMSVTPARVGELIRMRWLRRETGWPVERTAPLALVDRAADLAAMALILALALAFAASGITFALPVAMVALLAAWVATRPKLIVALVTFAYRTSGRLPRSMARARGAARSLARFSTLPVATGAMVLSLVGWAAEGYALHLLLVWMGADIGLAKAVAIFTFSTLAGGLTGAPGGLGGAEASMIALLTLEGVPLEVSVPATAIIRVTTLWFAIAIGLIVFPMAERASLKVAA